MSVDGAVGKDGVPYNIIVYLTKTGGWTGPVGMSSAPTHVLLRFSLCLDHLKEAP